jgi:hypothetical protein
MSSIIRDGDTFHGISVESRSVFKNKFGDTYAGQCKDSYACGLAVLTLSDGTKAYAEYGPDGKYDGRYLGCYAHGDTVYYLFERGEEKEYALVWADGRCEYNGEACAPDDPRVLALIAQVAPVVVRPAAPAPHPQIAAHSHPSNRPMDQAGSFCPRRRWRPPRPPRCIPTPHAVAGGRAAQPNSRRTVPRDRIPPEPSCRALQFWSPVSVGQAEEAVANLPLRLAVRVHCGRRSLAGYSRGTEEAVTGYSLSTHGVL